MSLGHSSTVRFPDLVSPDTLVQITLSLGSSCASHTVHDIPDIYPPRDTGVAPCSVPIKNAPDTSKCGNH
jgi:hypothetical protein